MQRRTVLVVDDDERVRDLIDCILQIEGYDTMLAADGEQALRLAGEHVPDLVTIDIMMPGMDGWELSRRLREDPATAGVVQVMVSGALGEHPAPDGQPADAILAKPFDFAAFAEVVEHQVPPTLIPDPDEAITDESVV